MLKYIGIIAVLVVAASILWFLWSLLNALFPSRRAAAVRGIKGSALTFVASLVIALALSIVQGSHLRDAEIAAANETAAAMDDDETVEAVALPDTTPTPPAKPTPEKPKEAQAAAPEADGVKRLSESKEFVWIRANQRILATKLRDPDSAKFDKDYASYKSGAPVVCGTVNAKNGFGGYSGAERYIGMGDTIGVFLESDVSDFKSLWRKVC